MAERLLESNNYSKFILLNFNRDVKKTEDLEKSMTKHGWIGAYPMHVVRNGDGKLRIKAGHHRFVVAKKLGIPVKYVECEDDATIYELEKATNGWELESYLESYVRGGLPAYTMVKRYREKTGIPLSACASMMCGNSAGSGNYTTKFKDGSYALGDLSHANIVADIVMFFKQKGIAWATNMRFIMALSKAVWAEGFDGSMLKKKVSRHPELMKKQGSERQYLELIEFVFNYGTSNKIPICFNADQAARERNVITHPEKMPRDAIKKGRKLHNARRIHAHR